MPIILNPPWPRQEPKREEDQKDIPMVTTDYRFTGYKMDLDSDGAIVRPLHAVTQPAWWYMRAVTEYTPDLR